MREDTTQRRMKIWQQYTAGVAWQRAMGFTEKFPQYVRFREGNQWPPATRRTRNMPRPVFNMVEMFIRTKCAAVLDQVVSINCRPANAATLPPEGGQQAEEGARIFTEYAAQMWKRLRQEELNTRLVESAATEGTGILHYYWDTTRRVGGICPYVGEVQGEEIDPLGIVFADPRQQDLQEQQWIILAQRLPVDTACALAAQGGAPGEPPTPDRNADPYALPEQDTNRVTVLTRYFRREGEVWFEKVTRNRVLIPPRPLTPAGSAARMTLYPLVLFFWKTRKNSIYGIGEAEELLPSQKALNFNMAMLLLSVQQTGWPRLITRPGALQQPVTNEPGELLVDYWQGGGDGIRYLQPPAFGSLSATLSEKVLQLSREVSGVNRISTGDTYSSNLAAATVLALQNQEKTPIRQIQRRFWRAMEQVGAIWLEFFRCYCNTPRPLGNRQLFVGTQYAGTEYEMMVEAGASGEYSELLSQSTLDKLLEKGLLSLEEYVELSGVNVAPFRERFRQMKQYSAQTGQPEATLTEHSAGT